MFLKIAIVSVLVKLSQQYCLPCPSEPFILSSFTVCDCPLGKFHDSKRSQCVDYLECPTVAIRNPLPDIKTLAPVFYEMLSNTVDTNAITSKFRWPRDVDMALKAINNRLDLVKRQLPGMFAPIVAPALVKNKNLFGDCKGKPLCLLVEALKLQDKKEVMPRLKPILFTLTEQFIKIFDDLGSMAKGCTAENNCKMVKALVSFKNNLPGVDGIKKAHLIATEAVKYLFSDLEKYIPLLKNIH